jgi:hypothetical protein
LLSIPEDSWPASLLWNCHQCRRLRGDTARLCSHCHGGNRSQAWALRLLLDSIFTALTIQMPFESFNHPTHLVMDTLIHILISPHNNRLTGLLTGAYTFHAARTCICVDEERELQAKT